MQHEHATHHLERDAASVRRVRAWLVDLLTTRHTLPEDRVEDAAVIVSELASNVLAHTDGPGRVEVQVTADSVRIEVHDSDAQGRPVVRPASGATACASWRRGPPTGV